MRKGIIKKIAGLVVLVVMVISMLLPGGTAAAFSDIEGHWAGTSLRNWLEAGLAGGYPDGTFRPNNPVTRAEFVTFLNQAFALSGASGETRFTDVPVTAWFYNAVSAATEAGIVTGYPDGTFKPQNPITRQEAAVLLTRLLEPGEGDPPSFTDGDQIAYWAANAVSLVAAAGIVGGYPDGSFRPGSPITRAETVIVLDRGLAMLRPEQEEMLPQDEVILEHPVTFAEANGLKGVEIQIYRDVDHTEINAIGNPITTDSEGLAIKELGEEMYWFRAVIHGYQEYHGEFFVHDRSKTVEFEMTLVFIADPFPDPGLEWPPQEELDAIPVAILYREGVGVYYKETFCQGIRRLFGGIYNVELELNKVIENFGSIADYRLQLTIEGKTVRGRDANNNIIDTFLIIGDYAVLPAIQQNIQDEAIAINPITLAEGTVSLVK